MVRRLGLFALAIVLISVRVAVAESLVERDIRVGGDSRRAYLHFPNGKPRSNLPAVVVFHGGGGNAKSMIQMTNMNATADAAGFVAVYPEGNPASRWLGMRFETWNGGRCCGSAAEENKDDVGFIAALIDDLVAAHGVDPTRIYLTGLSNGAQMAYRAACELSDRIAAIAPVGSIGVYDACRPSRSVPVLHIHGTADPCARFDGGMCGGCFAKASGIPGGGKTWPCESVPNYISRWRAWNRCDAKSAETYRRGSARCTTSHCTGTSEVSLCTIEGGGHTWPGGTTPLVGCDRNPERKRCRNYDAVVGITSNDLDASSVIWEFFSRHKTAAAPR